MTRWIGEAAVLAIHDAQLNEHGGPAGIRDEGALESALARPVDRAAYGSPDIFELAAAYAFGLSRNHPFIDGNKRVSLVVTELFLDLNGYALRASDIDCVSQWQDLSSGAVSEADMAAWLKARCERRL